MESPKGSCLPTCPPKLEERKRKPEGRRRGGQPGNRNRWRHGAFSRAAREHRTALEADLARMDFVIQKVLAAHACETRIPASEPTIRRSTSQRNLPPTCPAQSRARIARPPQPRLDSSGIPPPPSIPRGSGRHRSDIHAHAAPVGAPTFGAPPLRQRHAGTNLTIIVMAGLVPATQDHRRCMATATAATTATSRTPRLIVWDF
jgi:hypothetical protein